MTRFRSNIISIVILLILGLAALGLTIYNFAILGKVHANPSQTPEQSGAASPLPTTSLIIYPTAGLTPYESRTPRVRPLIPRLFVTIPITPTRQPTLTNPFRQVASPTSRFSAGPCSCQGDTLDCTYADFASLADAQACYDYCMGAVGYDVHTLDQNFDGVACESGLH